MPYLHQKKTIPKRLIITIGVVLFYAAFSALWVIAPDKLLTFVVDSAAIQGGIDLEKSVIFVTITSSLLYLLLKDWGKTLVNPAIVRGDAFNTADISLKESLVHTQSLVDSALDGVISMDRDGRIIGWNPQASHIFGYSVEQALGCEVAELIVPPRYRKAHRQGIARFLNADTPTIINTRIEVFGMRRNVSEFPMELSITAVERQGEYFFSAYVRDLTERKQAETELRIAATAFESQEAMAITDANQVILKVNQAFTLTTGYSAEEAIGKTPAILKSGRHDKKFYGAMWETLNRDKFWQGEIWNRRKDGEQYPERLSISAVTDSNGEISNYVAVFVDITEHKKSEETIHNLAFYDPLTGLPNRRLLIERLHQAMNFSTRHINHGAILFIDLDNFKELNDIKGHDIGDLLLVEVAKRLQCCACSSDTVACLGGDDFVVVLEELSIEIDQAATQAESFAEKIRIAINQPFDLNGLKYHNSSSIGISLFRNHEINVDDLLKHADTAMYQAKRSGRNTIRFFDPATHAAMETRIALGTDLRLALPGNQFRLYYQMQVDNTGKIIGAEVLIRWQHPELGLVPPIQFIPLTEESGLIVPIGQWVLETACAQIKRWECDISTRHLQLAVNVSALQFRQPDFVEQVCAVLETTAIKPSNLKLELTESLVLEDVNDTITKIQALKEMGIHFSMDDFGTGYSSLAYLSKLPLDQLKIDQSFVYNIGINHSDAVIVQTIIGMANNLDMEVIAEGVETEQQRDFLERNGCTHYQGYLFGKPVPLEEFEQLLHR
jgi:diguanylate cyclase (GGDEF)-like protein/PAS domain S-box-containing protein